MIARLKQAWATAPWLMTGFALALFLTVFFGVRFVADAIYWADPRHTDQPMAGWMTPGYVAMSWRVPREVMRDVLGMQEGGGGRQRLDDLAASRGQSVAELAAEIEAAIIAYRATISMTETALSLVASYGALIVAICAFLSCLLVPIPTSLVMLSAGAFVAAGDLSAVAVWSATLVAAILGDQTGYWIGRKGGAPVLARISAKPARAQVMGRARAVLDRNGGLGVFFSTWLFAPLGPYVNFVAGAAGITWLRFALWDAAGEAIWVSAYLALGYAFGDRVDELADLLGNLSGFLVAGVATVLLGLVLVNRLRSVRGNAPSADPERPQQ